MEKELPKLIQGGSHQDQRGSIQFLNDFDMSPVKRFYCITNANTEVKRGWRGHKIEQRWFFASQGVFSIKLVAISNWDKPDPATPITEFVLDATEVAVLHVPAGFASLVQATTPNALLTVFADHHLSHAKFDDYLYDVDCFKITTR